MRLICGAQNIYFSCHFIKLTVAIVFLLFQDWFCCAKPDVICLSSEPEPERLLSPDVLLFAFPDGFTRVLTWFWGNMVVTSFSFSCKTLLVFLEFAVESTKNLRFN